MVRARPRTYADGDRPRTLDERIARVEAQVSSIADSVETLAHSQKHTADTLFSAISKLSNRVSDGQRANWPVILSAATLVVLVTTTITGAVGWGVLTRIEDTRRMSNENHRDHIAHILEDTHPAARERLRALEREVFKDKSP